jgi:hypothetical protein
MVTVLALVSVALQFLPVGLWLALRAERNRALWRIALDIPLALAIDFLAVLLLARVFRLETAVLVSRGLWLAGAAGYFVWRRRQLAIAWPRALDRAALGTALMAATLGLLLSTALSRTCHNHDRGWHMPLVASIRGQRLPFMNVYQPQQALEYHYTGDALAAALQTLSFNVIHASHAITLAHDYLFALTALTVALLLKHFGMRGFYAALGALGMLLAGPLTLFSPRSSAQWSGYNFLNYFTLSFRPHCALAGLLVVGFVGSIAVRLRERDQPPSVWSTALPMVASTALLTLTDEATIGLLGAALGLTWLVVPDVVHERRTTGMLLFVALLAAVLLPHFLLAGTLAPGAVANEVRQVPWRAPGFYSLSVPLTNPAGLRLLGYDVFPIVAATLAALLSLVRPRGRAHVAAVLFGVVLVALSLVGLCAIEVVADVPHPPKGGWAVQNHRFMTAALLVVPLLSLYLLTLFRNPRRGRVSTGFASAVMVGAMALGAVSTLQWLKIDAPKHCFQPRSFSAKLDFYALDCRSAMGARFGEEPAPTYGDKVLVYPYAGCRPTFLAGRAPRLTYRLKVGGAAFGNAALVELQKTVLKPGEPLVVVCPREGPQETPCEVVQRAGSCEPAGSQALRCVAGEKERKSFMRSAREQPRSPTPPPATSSDEPEDPESGMP